MKGADAGVRDIGTGLRCVLRANRKCEARGTLKIIYLFASRTL